MLTSAPISPNTLIPLCRENHCNPCMASELLKNGAQAFFLCILFFNTLTHHSQQSHQSIPDLLLLSLARSKPDFPTFSSPLHLHEAPSGSLLINCSSIQQSSGLQDMLDPSSTVFTIAITLRTTPRWLWAPTYAGSLTTAHTFLSSLPLSCFCSYSRFLSEIYRHLSTSGSFHILLLCFLSFGPLWIDPLEHFRL